MTLTVLFALRGMHCPPSYLASFMPHDVDLGSRKRATQENVTKSCRFFLFSAAGKQVNKGELKWPFFLFSPNSKPEVEGTVTKAEVKQIQRNLKTMPLEDGRQPDDPSKDMDDVESDNGSNGSRDHQAFEDRTMDDTTKLDQSEDLESSTSDLGDLPREGSAQPDQDEISRPTSADQKSPVSSESSTPKMGGGFSNTSTASPFANVASTTNVFGSSSSTLKGLSTASTASPFAAVDKSTNMFDSAPSTSAFSGGFSNTSSVSPFATMAGSTNVFGEPAKSVFDESPKSVFGETSKSVFGETSKSVFGESSSKSVFSSTSSSGFGSFSTPEETTGSVFGSKSVLGSTTNSGSQSASLAPVSVCCKSKKKF